MSARMNGQEMGLHVEEVQDPEVCWSEVARACGRWLKARGLERSEGAFGFIQFGRGSGTSLRESPSPKRFGGPGGAQ